MKPTAPSDNPATRASANRSYYGTSVEIEGQGILIQGPSGSGKSSLAFGLLEQAYYWKIKASLVSDDQTILIPDNGQLTAHAPEPLQGLVELRGFGIVKMAKSGPARVTLIANMVDEQVLPRMPDPIELNQFQDIPLAHPVRYIDVPKRHEKQSIRIIFAALNSLGVINPVFGL